MWPPGIVTGLELPHLCLAARIWGLTSPKPSWDCSARARLHVGWCHPLLGCVVGAVSCCWLGLRLLQAGLGLSSTSPLWALCSREEWGFSRGPESLHQGWVSPPQPMITYPGLVPSLFCVPSPQMCSGSAAVPTIFLLPLRERCPAAGGSDLLQGLSSGHRKCWLPANPTSIVLPFLCGDRTKGRARHSPGAPPCTF